MEFTVVVENTLNGVQLEFDSPFDVDDCFEESDSMLFLVCKYLKIEEGQYNSVGEVIDELFDGQEIEAYGVSNPDNLYVNGLYEVDTQEALIDYAKILNHGEYEQLVNEDRLSAYVEEHEEEIVSRINDSYIYLGHDDDSWFLLQ